MGHTYVWVNTQQMLVCHLAVHYEVVERLWETSSKQNLSIFMTLDRRTGLPQSHWINKKGSNHLQPLPRGIKWDNVHWSAESQLGVRPDDLLNWRVWWETLCMPKYSLDTVVEATEHQVVLGKHSSSSSPFPQRKRIFSGPTEEILSSSLFYVPDILSSQHISFIPSSIEI